MTLVKSLGLALALSFSAGTAQAGNCTQPADVQAMASGVAAGLNAQRRANGLPAIDFNARLSAAAQTQACDLASSGRFGHAGSDGSNSHARVLRAGYQSCLTAENLAWGYPDAARIVGGWMASPGHRANMLHSRVDEFGIGIANGPQGPIWVLVVARGC